MGRGGSARFEEAMVHPCGKELWTPASYAIHAKSCDGTKPATEGRIAAREAAMGRPRSPFVDEKTERRRESFRRSKARGRGVDLDQTVSETPVITTLATITADATGKAMQLVIAGLLAKRDAIDRAISALQAVSA